LWTSRGLVIIGFEVKVSRGDFLSELKNPAKSEAIMKFCDHWFVVTPKDVVRDGELPKTWGHMEVNGRGCRVVKDAPDLEPIPITRVFMAAIARTVHKNEFMPEEIQAKIDKAAKDARTYEKASASYTVASLESEKKSLKDSINNFQETSGLKIDTYRGPKIAEAIRVMTEKGSLEYESRIADIVNRLSVELDLLRDAQKQIENFNRQVANK
jgi:hypothetical protein